MANVWKRLIVVLALLAALLWFLALGGLQQFVHAPLAFPTPVPELPPRVALFASQNEQNFIVYRDIDYRFEIRYPIGYRLSQNLPIGGRVIFSASTFDNVELISVDVRPGVFTDADFAEIEATYDTTVTRRHKTTIGGRTAYVIESELDLLDEPPEKAFLLQAAFPGCRDVRGQEYTALITAAFPQKLWSDLPLAEYMIYSFRCRS